MQPHTLTEAEVSLAKSLTSDSGLQKLMIWGNNGLARKSICDILCHLAFEDSEFSKHALEWLLARIGKVGAANLAAYTMAVESLVMINDRLQQDRVSRFVALFAKFCNKDVMESYLSFSRLTDMFITLALQCPAIRKKMQSDPDTFAFILGWLKRHPYPIEGEVSSCPVNIDLLGTHGQSSYRRKGGTSRRSYCFLVVMKSRVDRAACKHYNKLKLTLLEQLGTVGNAKHPAPDVGSLTFSTEQQHCMLGPDSDYSERAIASKSFDIRYC